MKNMYELFKEITDAPDDDVRVYILHHNARQIVLDVLQGAFHPAIQFCFKNPVDYNRSDSPPGMGYSSIEQEFKRIYLFTEGSTRADPNLTFQRKTVILAQMLEAMEEKEADVFMNMLMKDLQVPGLTYQLVKRAFPDLLP